MTRALKKGTVATTLLLFAQQGCLLTSDFDGLASGGGSATSTSTGADGDCCLGQVCGANGQCQPFELVNDAIASSIALTADSIYWTDSTYSAVRALAKDAPFGSAPTVVVPSTTKPGNLVATSSALFFSTYDEGGDTYKIQRKDLEGDAEAVEIASGPGRVTSLGVDATHAYFSTISPSSTSSMFRCLQTGGAVDPLVSDSPYAFLSITFDAAKPNDGYVYWARANTFPEGALQRIHKDKLGAEMPVTMVGSQSAPRSLAVSDGTLFWANSGMEGTYGYRLMSATTAGEDLTVLNDALPSPWAVAKLGSQLAWTGLGAQTTSGDVAVTDLTTQETRVLATGQAWPGSVAIDERAVYWANEYDNRLQKVGTCTCQPP